MEFKAFPKIKRLTDNLNITVTEKIDGTNGLIAINDEGEMLVGSRSRVITPNTDGKQTDNYGFAKWAYENKEELLKLGRGYHYGEWWGAGIQRRYGMAEKKFSLFNTHMLKNPNLPECVDVVPVLYEGVFLCTDHIMRLWDCLNDVGSQAAPGYMNPEGLMVFFHFNKTYLKLPMNK